GDLVAAFNEYQTEIVSNPGRIGTQVRAGRVHAELLGGSEPGATRQQSAPGKTAHAAGDDKRPNPNSP
ncbi:MAG TPA: hypothetical protein VI756_02550, partial [Blastocatellia bacterium]